MRFDRAFLGICSLSAEEGVRAFDFADASFKRGVVASARRTVALATSDKFTVRAPHHVAGLEQLDLLVVEPGIAPAQRVALEAAGCRRILAAG
jgi:DeoR/GlpR family transcriptional regulator of sugar metabolism